jgi:hypothetical protein
MPTPGIKKMLNDSGKRTLSDKKEAEQHRGKRKHEK